MSRSTETRYVFVSSAKAASNGPLRVRVRRIAKITKACQDLPGQEPLQYVDEAGSWQAVTSSDVNDYLKEVTARGDGPQ